MADIGQPPVLIAGGRIVDVTGERVADVAVGYDGKIADVAENLDRAGYRVLDASGCVVTPGLVDLHTHLREPGREEAETVESGSRAAALGGYTAVVAMPNTEPALDDAGSVREVIELGRRALCDVFVAGAITVGRRGEALAPMAEMAELGVRIFTDDGCGVQSDRLMRRALEYSTGLGVTLAQHCEVESLSDGGHMHEGAWSSRLGIPGIPGAAEDLMVMRDIELCRMTGGRVHFQHLSTSGSVALVRAAKAEGLAVSAEATPHHFTLTHAEVAAYDPVFKVNPPLRTEQDVAAVREGLADGTIDAIATDHAPHARHEKEKPFDEAPCGMLGLETALGLALSVLDLPLEKVLALMSWQPARIAGIGDSHGGSVVPGSQANLCVIDTAREWVVESDRLASRSRNTPFTGRLLRGRVKHTLLHGEPVVIDEMPMR